MLNLIQGPIFNRGHRGRDSVTRLLLPAIITAMTSEEQIRSHIVEVGRWLYDKRLITATEGNISARLGGRVFITPSQACKGMLSPDDIVETDLGGSIISGSGNPSSEIIMHLAIYRERTDVRAFVHAHPAHATAFAVAGIALDKPVLPEVVVSIGEVPLVGYATPGTIEMAESLRPVIATHDVLLLGNHGAVSCGPDLRSAYFRMETLEHFAWISTVARMLGGERELTPDQVARLKTLI
jgi:L-fuculose-phosphate aldolase